MKTNISINLRLFAKKCSHQYFTVFFSQSMSTTNSCESLQPFQFFIIEKTKRF
jgi:hypothetical protein